MDSNPLLHAQFPSAASLERLEAFLREYSVLELQDPKVGVLLARDVSSDDVVSFAKWEYPSSSGGEEGTKLETGDLRHLEGCRQEFLERYAALAEAAKARAFGDKPCYRLTFVCTDPMFQGLGAGSLLTRHVLSRAKADHMPVYLESTLDAVHLYEKLGFTKLEGFKMQIPRRGGDPDELSEVYEEVCMAWWPDEMCSSAIRSC